MDSLCVQRWRRRARQYLKSSVGGLALLLQFLPAHAQAPPTAAPAAGSTPPQGLLSCDPIIGQPLVKIHEIVSTNGVLRGTILLSDHQERMAFRTPPNAPGSDEMEHQVRQPPRANNQPTITEQTFKDQFDKFFVECEKRLKADPLDEWPQSWNDAPLGPPSDPNSYIGMQIKLLQAYDNGRPPSQQLWPVDKAQYDQGRWPQYYIGAYPYCFRLPEYTSRGWPPAP